MSHRISFVLAVLLALASSRAGFAVDLLQEQPFIPTTMGEEGRAFPTGGATRVQVIADRVEYLQEDLYGQFLVSFLGVVKSPPAALPGAGEPEQKIVLSLKDEAGHEVAAKSIAPVKSPKLPVLVSVSDLKPGKYTLSATLADKAGKTLQQAAATFWVSDRKEPHAAFPKEGIAIAVHPQSFVPDGTWPISTGVPMANVTMRAADISSLTLLENGKPVPAQFSVRATWSPKGYVKWVGLDFAAKYDKGIPRKYTLVRTPGKPGLTESGSVAGKPGLTESGSVAALKVTDTPENITVDTGAIKFVIGRKFAGIEQAWMDANKDGQYTDNELVLSGKGGSFLVDSRDLRFDAANSKDGTVVVEESGPMRVTIAAMGTYANEKSATLCKYVVRITAYAGQPFIYISHRTINTIADLFGETWRIADCGFEVVPNGAIKQWRFGYDGTAKEGAAPASGGGGASIFLHQDRDDHLRLMQADQVLGEGKRSDGWCSAQTAQGSATFILRDMWQKFPKEFEFDLAAGGTGKMTTHFWPRHGHDAFTEADEVSRANIYKVRWAHEGKLLEFLIPANYHKTLEELNTKDPWALDGELSVFPDGKTKMQHAGGQGTVIGGDLYLWLNAAAPAAEALKATAGLVQQGPHAMSDPQWNAATQVYGKFAARNPQEFPVAEKAMDSTYVTYRKAIIDGCRDYGMWIYGAVHGDWDAKVNLPAMRRTWQMCHYQNVFQAWLLYMRSGSTDAYEWARIHSNQHLDVGVANYRAYPPGTYSYSHMGDIGGDMYHCKGFMPWAGNSSTSGHWIDITHYFTRYYLTGDRRGLDMAARWINTWGIMGFPTRNVIPTTADGIQSYAKLVEVDKFVKANPNLKPEELPQWIKDERAKPANFNPRECLVPLGELTQYYQSTWDPQVLLYLSNHAEYLNLPFKDTQSPGLSDFGKHWHEWYYGLTRDPRVVQRIKEYMKEQSGPEALATSASFSAFLYHATADKTYLQAAVNYALELVTNIYDNPEDRFHGFSSMQQNPSAMILGRLPFLMHAVHAAGMKFEAVGAGAAMPSRGGRYDSAASWLSPKRGWSNAGLTVLGIATQPVPIAVRVTGPVSYGDFRGFYMLFYDFPEINAPLRPGYDIKASYAQQQEQIVKFSGTTVFKDPPTQRNFTSYAAPGTPYEPLPHYQSADNDKSRLLYRVELGGSPVDLPVLTNADTHAPLTQIAVVARTTYAGNEATDSPFYFVGYTNCWLRPLDPKAKIQLHLKAQMNRYGMPTMVRVEDADGKPIGQASVFPGGLRKEARLTLDGAVNPPPWRIIASSCGDDQVYFTGADELFFATDKADFDKVIPKIPIYTKPQ